MPGVALLNSMPQVSLKKSSVSEETNALGLTCVKTLSWSAWLPGREYMKDLIIRNVSQRNMKLSFTIPKTRFFSTVFPKPFILNVGTTFSLPVTFRPLELVEYEDVITFSNDSGSFDVCLQAFVPQFSVTLPELVSFNMCAVGDSRLLTIELSNESDAATEFKMTLKGPFSVKPSSGNIAKSERLKIEVTFSPNSARCFESSLVCNFGPELAGVSVCKLFGIAKYSSLIIEGGDTACDFGSVAIGQTVQSSLIVANNTEVSCPFRIDLDPLSLKSGTFTWSPKSGVCPPSSNFLLNLTYTPNCVNVSDSELINLRALPSGCIPISLSGRCVGPLLQLSRSVVNFQLCSIGHEVTRCLELINDNDIDAGFQFLVDERSSVFTFDIPCGLVVAHSKKTVLVRFAPTRPIVYHRNIVCLVHDMGPLFVDLIGTAHDDTLTENPGVITKEHLARFKQHCANDIARYPPDVVAQMVANGSIVQGSDLVCRFLSDDADTIEPHLAPMTDMDRYFLDGNEEVALSNPFVSVDTNVLNFSEQAGRKYPQDVYLTNHTKGKIIVCWTRSSQPFHVSPEMAEVLPSSSCCFSVYFEPTEANRLFGAYLEAFCYYKSMRDHTLVDHAFLTPPFSVILSCFGHSFPAKSDRFLPAVEIVPPPSIELENIGTVSVVHMPPIRTTDRWSYSMFLLSNRGPDPLLCSCRSLEESVSVKPQRTLVRSGQVQVFVVCLRRPLDSGAADINGQLVLEYNDDQTKRQVLSVVGRFAEPELLLPNDGVVYLRPTCVTLASVQSFVIRNLSPVDLRFDFRMSAADAKQLSLHPKSGVVVASQKCSIEARFEPIEEGRSFFKPTLLVWIDGAQENSSPKYYPVRFIGRGFHAKLECEKEINFGYVLTGSSAGKMLTLFNNNPCPVEYELTYEKTDEPFRDRLSREKKTFECQLDHVDGFVAANSSRPMRVLLRSYVEQQLTVRVLYRLKGHSEWTTLSTMTLQSIYPQLRIADVKAGGCCVGLSKRQFWNYLKVDTLNDLLSMEPSMDEVKMNMATRQSYRSMTHEPRSIVDVNFGASPQGSAPAVVSITLENCGAVPCSWLFSTPQDMEHELEYWAESGQLTRDELQQLQIHDSSLFVIRPTKSGSLNPGQRCTLHLICHHEIVGHHKLPVLWKIANGREILLNFVGVTPPLQEPYLHFDQECYTLKPIGIGEQQPPAQHFEMFNGGSVPIRYFVDTDPLNRLTEENFNQPVLELDNAEGVISPAFNGCLKFRFRPMEAKTYQVTLIIMYWAVDDESFNVMTSVSELATGLDADAAKQSLITLVGVGYDNRLVPTLFTALAASEFLPGAEGTVASDANSNNDANELAVSITNNLKSALEPKKQLHISPAQLSVDRLEFGVIPSYSRRSKLVFVRNKSTSAHIDFEWLHVPGEDSAFISIAPTKGRVEPAQSCLCRVHFSPLGEQRLFNCHVLCKVTNATEMDKYTAELSEWTAEYMRMKHEFDITDMKQRIPAIPAMKTAAKSSLMHQTSNVRPEPTQRLCDSPYGGSKISDKESIIPPTYKTIPNSIDLKSDQKRRLAQESRKFTEQYWLRPQPPRPEFFPLGIFARSVTIEQFQQNWPDEVLRHFIDQAHEKPLTTQNAPRVDDAGGEVGGEVSQPKNKLECSKAESDTLKRVIAAILRSMLHDKNYVDAIRRCQSDAVPYFVQFRREGIRKSEILAHVDSVLGIEEEHSGLSRPLAESKRPNSATSLPTPTVSRPTSSPSRSVHSEPAHHFNTIDNTPNETDTLTQRDFDEHMKLIRSAEFASFVEKTLENTLGNILTEATRREFNVTNRRFLVALPPKRGIPPNL